MKISEHADLVRRVRQSGIQSEFTDASGVRRKATVETLRALLELLGESESKPSPVPPVIICWGGRPKTIQLSPASLRLRLPRSPVTYRLESERQTAQETRVKLERSPNSSVVLHIPRLPIGYHHFRFEVDGSEHQTLIISAPTKAYSTRDTRDWGIFVPMYAVHSRKSWGAGNLSDWQGLCESLAELRGGSGARGAHRSNMIVATLPLLGAFLEDWKCEPSPYSPATRLFWNEFYLDVTRVPELASCKTAQRLIGSQKFQKSIETFRRSPTVDYQAEMKLRRRVLEPLAAEFFSAASKRRSAFHSFQTQRLELDRYAEFRAVCDRRKESWHTWPERLRHGRLQTGDYNPSVKDYHLFVQWLAQEQMDTLLARCRERGVKFYLDLPLGVNPDGYDVWANQHLFVNGASVGAPPDAFFTKGQDWGFPPLHPQRIREDRYRYVIEYLRFQMRHTGLLRLDHVMGLHRLWWVPPGASAAEGAYVRYNAEELYAILCLESHFHQTALIGENLGTVPPEVNKSMKRHGLRTMYVAQYEAQPKGKQLLREPPRDCVASINTHDMPMWAAHWKGLDIVDRKKLGLLTANQARDEKRERARLRSSLQRFLQRKRLLTGRGSAREVLNALLKFLGRSEAELVLVNLEDLCLETRPQNTPGTSIERVNWQRKMKMPLEGIANLLAAAPKRTPRRRTKSRAR